MAKVTVTTQGGAKHEFVGDNVGIEHYGDRAVRLFEYTPYKLLAIFYNPDSVVKEG